MNSYRSRGRLLDEQSLKVKVVQVAHARQPTQQSCIPMPKTRSQTLCETEKAAVQQHELPIPEADDAVISVGAIDVDQLSCVLEIKTSQEPYFVPPLSNRFEHTDTEVVECKMSHPGMFTDEGGIEDLTASEMTSVACNGTTPSVRRLVQRPRGHLRGEHGGKWLTVMEFNSQLFFAILHPRSLQSPPDVRLAVRLRRWPSEQ